MKENIPLVSVIVPVYNVEKYVSKTIEGLLNQTYKNIEIIIVNDGTKDNSIKVIESKIEFLKEEDIDFFNRFKILNKENGGLSSARNFGLKYANGKYITFLDSDDYYAPNALEEMIKKAENEGLDFVESNYTYIYEKDYKKEHIAPLELYNNKNEFLAKGRVFVLNKLYKKEIIDKFNLSFQEGVLYEDIGFTHKYILNSKKIGYIEKSLCFYLQRKGSITASKSEKGKLDIIKVLEDLINYYKSNKDKNKNISFYKEYESELEYLCLRLILGSSLKRMLMIENKNIREEYILKTYEFLINNFPKYRRNKYLKFNLKKAKNENIKNIIFKLFNKNLLKIVSRLK